jgi:copper(I)-binding protein
MCLAAVLAGCSEKSLAVSLATSHACAARGECAVYLTITNPGQTDAVIGAHTDVAAEVELHRLMVDEQGRIQMQPIDRVPLPASSAVAFRPGSQHLMLVDLRRELEVGDTFALTLLYEKGGESTVQVVVMPEN